MSNHTCPLTSERGRSRNGREGASEKKAGSRHERTRSCDEEADVPVRCPQATACWLPPEAARNRSSLRSSAGKSPVHELMAPGDTDSGLWPPSGIV